MQGRCRLCLENVELKESHIIPKFFFREVIKNSITGKMRASNNINKIIQDGLKTPFLCGGCEGRFSKYETYFSKNVFQKVINNPVSFQIESNDDSIRYFILSLSWRYMQFIVEYEENQDIGDSRKKVFTEQELYKLRETLETWGQVLENENFGEIRKIQMHLIPLENIEEIKEYKVINQNGVAPDYFTLDEENQFKYALVFFKVPHLIILNTLWGKTDTLKSYLVGKRIKSRNSRLPKHIYSALERAKDTFETAYRNLSETQKKATVERVKKKLTN
jgi:hypothetical protein